MKIIRLQIPGNFLEYVGFAELFQELEFVDILNAFQYDQTHFFALQKIRFKADKMINLNDFMASFIQCLNSLAASFASD